MAVDERNAAAVKRAGAAPGVVADAATANKRLHASLTAIVRAGIEAGAFENPLDGRTWTPAWRAALALTALRFRVLARRCAVGPVAPAAHSPTVLLEILDSLTAPEGCSLLAVVLETMPALERAPVKAADTHSPAAVPVVAGEARKPIVMLLADVRAVFKAKGNPERIRSAALDRALRTLPDRPWRSMPSTGKPLSAQGRGRMLAAVGIRARTLQFDGAKDAKGYERTAFVSAWRVLL